MFQWRGELTEEDFFKFNLYHLYGTPEMREEARRYRVFCVIGYAILGLCFFLVAGGLQGIILGVLSVGVSLLYLFAFRQVIKRKIRKGIEKIKERERVPFGGEADMVFGEENIQVKTAETDERAKYSIIEEIIIGEDAFYLYRSFARAYIVPFRAFETEEQRRDFLKFVEGKTNLTAVVGKNR